MISTATMYAFCVIRRKNYSLNSNLEVRTEKAMLVIVIINTLSILHACFSI